MEGERAEGSGRKPELVATELAISIIVPCRNEICAIGPFLDSLRHQDFSSYNWEVIIADGMSNDGTRDFLHDFQRANPRVRVIDNPEQTTPAGLNEAIRSANGEIILRMDVHTEYAPDYVRTCVETLLSKNVGNVGGPARTRATGLLPRSIAAAYHSPFACGSPRFHDPNYEGPADTVPYGCWRKETLERLGLFDTELVRNQDDELNLRMIRQGDCVWQTPAIKSWYSPRPKLSSLFKQYYQYGFWKIPVIVKHKIPASWRHLVPGTFVLVNALLLVSAMAALTFGQLPLAELAATLLALILGVYLLCILAFGLLAARRYGWALLPYLPLVFATYHVSYGLGFLTGVVYFATRKFRPMQPGRAFTQVTR